MHTISDKKLLMLKPSQIRIMSGRARKNIETEALKKLADSISLNGIIEPLAVRKNRDGFYELVSGERRLRAAAMAGLRRVPCVLHNVDNATLAIYSVTENLQRKPLHFFEEAQAIYDFLTRFGLTYTETALRLGLTQAELNDKLQLLNLSRDIRERIISKGLSEEYARALLLLPEYQRYEVLHEVIKNSLNLFEARNLVESKLEPEESFEEEEIAETVTEEPQLLKPVRKHSIGDVRLFGNSLQKLTDTLRSAGIDVNSRKTENDKYIEYKVRIKKEPVESGDFKQLKIC